MTRGRFITLEGGEGAGKSSLMACLEACLEERGRTVRRTREPGGTPAGEAVRDILLANRYGGMCPETELLLIFAARAQHLHEVIEPALERGEWVLCDRFTDASYAYQGFGRGLGTEPVAWLERWLQGTLRPDLTLLLDVPVATGLARATANRGADRFEDRESDFLTRVRKGYLSLAERAPERIRILDASRPRERVREQARAMLDAYLDTLDERVRDD